jgi:hypothetical protein
MAASPYAAWSNGPPQSAKFFPIAVWYQNPTVQGHSGAYPTIAAAAAGEKMNIFIGLGNWPERFGGDSGELEAIKSNNLYAIGGISTPYNSNTSAQSVSSVLSLAKSIGASSNVIGYNAGDEPVCPGTMQQVPAIVSGIQGYDATRIVAYNFTAWMVNPQWLTPTCTAASTAALQAVGFGSFDVYPATNAWVRYPGSDFQSVSQDNLFLQGLTTAALVHDGRAGQPMWVYIESGGDNLGFSGQNNNFSADVTGGSATLTNQSGWSKFTPTWVSLTVSGSGIPANTKIVSITDATHAVMSASATATSANISVAVTGGAGSHTDCVASANLCVVNGNEYRATQAQVNAQVWMSIINGAVGIEYFCHDSSSDSFCLGDQTGGATAATTQANLTYIDSVVTRQAPILNAPTAGICSMQVLNYTSGAQSTTTSCANGILTMATSQPSVPGMALVKQYGGNTYLFAQSDRRSTAGASFAYTLAGLAGKTATITYDSNTRYDRPHTTLGHTFTLNGTGQFSDVLGANNDDYQVKIYRIQ